jgi:hypothetical protein
LDELCGAADEPDLFQTGNNAVIEISASDMLTLVNTQISALSATNVKLC